MTSGCLLAAATTLAAGFFTGHLAEGLALAAGLLIGSVNAPMARRALSSQLGFGTTSVARLVALTVAALAVGALLGWGLAVALVVAGVALSQVIMAVASAREMLRT